MLGGTVMKAGGNVVQYVLSCGLFTTMDHLVTGMVMRELTVYGITNWKWFQKEHC